MKVRLRTGFLVFWVIVLPSWLFADTHTKLIISRLDALSNIRASYNHTVSKPVPEAAKAMILERLSAMGAKQSTQNSAGFSFPPENQSLDVNFFSLGSRVRIRTVFAPGDGYLDNTVQSFSNGRSEELQIYRSGKASGLIRLADANHLPDLLIDVGLGRRAFGSLESLGEIDVTENSLKTEESGAGSIELRFTDDVGEHCWVFDPMRTYAAVEYHFKYKESADRLEIACGDFRSVDGWQLPFRMDVIRHVGFGGHPTEHTEVIKVSEYVLLDPGNSEETYDILYPSGARVRDERTGQSFSVSAPERLSDEYIKSAILGRTTSPGLLQKFLLFATLLVAVVVISRLVGRSWNGR